MASKPRKPTKRKTPLPTPEEAQQRFAFMDQVVRSELPEGTQLDELESALGMYMLAHHFGWKVLYLIHTKRTIKKYEQILGIKLSEVFEPVGPDADRTNALKVIQAASNFWKAVSGEEKPFPDINKRAVS